MFKELMPYKKDETGVILRTKVTPNASADKIGKIIDINREIHLKLYVSALAMDNKANEAVLKLLSKWLGLSRNKFTLLSGMQHQMKTIHIEGDPETLDMLLSMSLRSGTW